MPLVLVGFPDYGVTPFAVNAGYTIAAQRQLVSDVMDDLNDQLQLLAMTHELVFVDMNGITRAIFGTNGSPNATLNLGNVPINLTGPSNIDTGSNPTGAFVQDGVHPNTTTQGIGANAIITVLNIGYQANLPVFSEQEVLAHRGIAYGGSDTLASQIGQYSDYVYSYVPTSRSMHFTAIDASGAVSGVSVATITIAPSVAISPATVSHSESDAGVTEYVFSVTLSAATGETVTVAYDTSDGSATLADNDYQTASGVLTFFPSQTVKQLTVLVHGDTANEADEDLRSTISSPTNASLGASSASGTIQNDEPLPSVAISPATLAQLEGDASAMPYLFTVTLSAASGQYVTVAYATADGTAILADNDYQAASGILTFSPGQTAKLVTVLVNCDTINEAVEDFTLTLSSPTNATLGVALAQGTIQNDDPLPTVAIGPATIGQAEGNAGTTDYVFTVTLSAVSGQAVTVNYDTSNGTATLADNDYLGASAVLTLSPGQTVKQVTVLVNGDTTNELNEDFALAISSPVNATLVRILGHRCNYKR